MKKPQLDFSRLNIPGKIQKTREIILKLTGNANFPTPNPTLPVLSAANNALETAYEAAADGGKTLKANMRAKEKILVDLMVVLEAYITGASGGDEQKILSSGFGVSKVPVHGKRRTSIVASAFPGEVIVTVESTSNKSIVATGWQYCKDPISEDSDVIGDANSNKWIDAGITTTSTTKISGLTTGEKYWFRYRTIQRKNITDPWHIIGIFLVPIF